MAKKRKIKVNHGKIYAPLFDEDDILIDEPIHTEPIARYEATMVITSVKRIDKPDNAQS